MQVADVLTAYLEQVDGVAAAVQDQIGGVEVDAHVGQSGILDGAEQRERRLLPGLEPEAETELLAVFRHVVDGTEHLDVLRIERVFRDEAAVRDDRGRAEPTGEVGAALEFRHAAFAEVLRHQPAGGGSVELVPDDLAGIAGPEGGDADARRLGVAPYLPRQILRQQIHVPVLQLAGLDAVIRHDFE